MTRLNPYLHFTGQANEALEFYRQALGGELRVTTFGQFGMDDEAMRDLVMHGQLEIPDGLTLMASDTPPGMERPAGTAITCSISGSDAQRLHEIWDALAQDAQVETELATQMWGDEFGQLTDRYGVPWLVNIAGDDQHS